MNINNFDRQHNSLRRWMIFISLVWLSIISCIVGFSGWVVIKLLEHFGVV